MVVRVVCEILGQRLHRLLVLLVDEAVDLGFEILVGCLRQVVAFFEVKPRAAVAQILESGARPMHLGVAKTVFPLVILVNVKL